MVWQCNCFQKNKNHCVFLSSIFAFIFFTSFNAQAVQEPSANETKINFETQKIKIKNKVILVEVADRPEKQSRGLMYRDQLAEGRGMLFVFPYAREQKFWMKNTFIPLSIAYFDKNKILLNIIDMAPSKSLAQEDFPTYDSKGMAQFALEVPKGWFKKNGIKSGDKFEILP